MVDNDQGNAPNGQGPNGMPPQLNVFANPIIDVVSNLRLPAFLRQSPAFWFNHAESTIPRSLRMFAKQRITSNASKVNFVVGALDEEAIRTIGDLLGTAASYGDIRTRLIDAYEVPKALRFREIVKPGGLGERRLSQLLRDMRSSVPPGIGEDALKEFWLQKLPSSVTAILVSLDVPLNKFASRADQVLDVSNPQNIDVLSKEQFNDLASAVSALSQHVQALTKIVITAGGPPQLQSQTPTRLDVHQPSQACYYHGKYGSKALKCRPPCNYKSKTRENDSPTPAEN